MKCDKGHELKKCWEKSNKWYCPICFPFLEQRYQERLKRMQQAKKDKKAFKLLNKIYKSEVK